MTQPHNEVDGFLLGSSSPIAKFETVGTTYSGKITEAKVVQKNDFKTQKPLYYDDGNPVKQLVVTLATNQRDPEVENDDGTRRVFLSQSGKNSLASAVRAAGSRSLEKGGFMSIRFTHETPSQGGSPKKEYEVTYTPPQAVEVNQTLQQGVPAEHQQPVAPGVYPQIPTQPGPAPAAPQVPGLPEGQQLSPELLQALLNLQKNQA